MSHHSLSEGRWGQLHMTLYRFIFSTKVRVRWCVCVCVCVTRGSGTPCDHQELTLMGRTKPIRCRWGW
jgi:hypothetical protein